MYLASTIPSSKTFNSTFHRQALSDLNKLKDKVSVPANVLEKQHTLKQNIAKLAIINADEVIANEILSVV